MYSVGEFAKLLKKSVKTIQRWDNEGILKSNRNPKNRRYYTHQQYLEFLGLKPTENSRTIAYCRVSSVNQKDDLKNQKQYIAEFSKNAGLAIDDFYEDIGSGLNFKRKNFNKLLEEVESGKIKQIVIAHKDRLVRFGYDWFEKFCINHSVKIILINVEKLSPEKELVDDLINIIHVFSCRIYGLRKYKKEIKDAINQKN